MAQVVARKVSKMEGSVIAIVLGLIIIFGSAVAFVLNLYRQGKKSFDGEQSVKSGAKNTILGYGLTVVGVALGILLVLIGLVFKFLV
jgi:uncharacterized membrane protein YidH (DUF202 family)